MKILLVDIETAPNTAHVWGLWQQNVGLPQLLESSYVLCWAAKWYKDEEVIFESLHKSNRKSMLKKIHALLDSADAVVHYNGKKFDIPTLNKEFVLEGMLPPAPSKQIDLLQVARDQFRFPSNRLDYVAEHLKCGTKFEHEGHEMWIKCMAGDKKAWKIMEDYNKQDVLLLEKVYDKLKPWIKGHANYGLYSDAERPVCPNCGSTSLVKRGHYYATTFRYPRYRCNACGKWSRGRLTDLRARINTLVGVE